MLPALVKIGETAVAASVFLQEEVPGWLAQVKRGATTIWERWDGILADGSIHESSMNSFNHYAYGAVCQWLFEAVAGIRPDPEMPAFQRIIFEPIIIPALSPVSAHHDSIAGPIDARWSVDGEAVIYEVAVPEGAEGWLVLSPSYREAAIDGVSVVAATASRLAPGPHRITFRIASETAA